MVPPAITVTSKMANGYKHGGAATWLGALNPAPSNSHSASSRGGGGGTLKTLCHNHIHMQSLLIHTPAPSYFPLATPIPFQQIIALRARTCRTRLDTRCCLSWPSSLGVLHHRNASPSDIHPPSPPHLFLTPPLPWSDLPAQSVLIPTDPNPSRS